MCARSRPQGDTRFARFAHNLTSRGVRDRALLLASSETVQVRLYRGGAGRDWRYVCALSTAGGHSLREVRARFDFSRSEGPSSFARLIRNGEGKIVSGWSWAGLAVCVRALDRRGTLASRGSRTI